MDEQDLQEQIRLLQQASDEIARTGMANVETFDRLRDSTNKFKQGIEKAEDAIYKFKQSGLGKTTQALGTLAKGIGSSALAARENRESFASLNPVIDAAASALGAIPIVGEAAGKVVAAVGKFATDELDKSVKAFQTLGAVGGIGAEGVQGLRDNAVQAGLSFQQLADVTGNKAGGLAFAFGSTATGLQEIANLTKAAEPFRDELLALGFNLQDQSETFVDYIDRSRRLGRAQETDQRRLAASSAEYAKNLTDLGRLTGMSVDQAQSELDSQMSNIRFRRAMSELDGDIQDAVSNVGVVIAGIGNDPALTQGFQDLVAGYGTQAGRDFALATGGVGETVAAQLKAGAITEQQAIEQIQAALKATYEKLPAQVFGAGTPFDNVSLGMANLANAQIDYANALKQGKDAADATDPATKQMVEAQLALQQLAMQADDLVNSQVFPVTTSIVKELGEAMAGLVGKINQLASGSLTGGESDDGYSLGDYNPFNLDNWARAFGVGTRATGGPVSADEPYVVGEQGPELMVPGTSGSIMNADQYTNVRDRILEEYVAQATHMPDMTPKPYKTGLAGQDPSEYDTFQFPNPTSVSSYPGLKAFVDYFLWNLSPGPNWFGREPGMPSAQLTSTRELKQMGSSFQEGVYDNHMARAAYYGAFNWQDWDLDRDGALDIIESGLVRSMLSPGTTDLGFLASEMTGKNNAAMDAFFENEFRKPEFATGGIASGPKTGYSAMLHGTEAVVPLPDGKSIPVEPKNSDSNNGLVALMENMIPLLEQVATNTRTGADTSKRILRASTA